MNNVRGIVFAGDSFTWGEGLELYSNYPSVQYEYYIQNGYHWPHVNEMGFVKKSHLEYIKANRFSRAVANRFDGFECVHDMNGGSFGTMKEHILKSIKLYGEDLSHLVVQFTEHLRDYTLKDSTIPGDGVKELLDNRIQYERGDISIDEYESSLYFKKWKDNFGEMTALEVDDFLFESNVITFLKWIEDISKSNNLVVKFIGTWTNDSYRYDKLHEYDIGVSNFYNNQLIKLKFDKKYFRSIFELTSNYRGFRIVDDLEWSDNEHPNNKLHNIIANNIINQINK